MSDAANEQAGQGGGIPLPNVRFSAPTVRPDLATILGVTFTFGLIAFAILSGESNADFINSPALMIVLGGTITATSISYTGSELAKAGSIFAKSLFRKKHDPSELALGLMDLAVIARKKGVLSLANYSNQLQKIPFLDRAIQLVIDGYPPEDIENLLTQEIDSLVERHKRSAGIMKRASEIAPAMGLIGTLVGLVQMLADLENPDTIGPAMAVALLTTFYGAILGTIIMAPMAVKLEKNSNDEVMIKSLILTATTSISRQENPRRLEMLLNSDLPPQEQIEYFDR